jgi:hypothetical protein
MKCPQLRIAHNLECIFGKVLGVASATHLQNRPLFNPGGAMASPPPPTSRYEQRCRIRTTQLEGTDDEAATALRAWPYRQLLNLRIFYFYLKPRFPA